MLKRLLLFIHVLTIGVLSQNVTFQNVQIECDTEDMGTFIIDIESSNILEENLPENVFRVSVLGDASVPIIYENAVSNLTRLKILQIQRHNVEEIEPGALKNLPLLEILRLNGNKITEIKDGVFNNLNLVFLNLEHNSIGKISKGAFDNITRLQVLGLDGNKLKKINPVWFNGKPNLTAVGLRYNEIEEIPDGAFDNYHNDIDLNHNRIQNLSRGIFGSGLKMGQLGLGDNNIEVWDESFLSGVKIILFDISNNQLKCLNGTLEKFFVAYQTWIYGNPWDCDCLIKIDKWTAEQKQHHVKLRSSLKKCTN